MAENIKQMNSNCRKKRLKELLDIGGQIRCTTAVEDNVVTINKISNIIKETDMINKHGDVKDRASNTTEVVMDAQVIQMSHELIGEVMQKMGNTEFSDEEWINAIIGSVFQNDNENWCELTKLTAEISKPAKYSSCLLGGFNLKQNVVENIEKEKIRRTKKNKSDELIPENVTQLEKHDGNTQTVMTIYRQIINLFMENKRVPIPYYKLIIDSNNYMKTVDNAFKVAFLVRDKSVAIEIGDDNLPYIRPLSKQDKANALNETIQAICSIHPKTVQNMAQRYQMTQTMLKLDV